VATAHSPSKCRYLPAAILHSDRGRALVPKDAESMGREDKPLPDFSSKKDSIRGITMHPLGKLPGKLRESGRRPGVGHVLAFTQPATAIDPTD
jgi:hypothetical protein